MSAILGRRRNGFGAIRASCLVLAFAAILPPASAAAGDGGDAAAGPSQAAPRAPADPPQSAPRWTSSAEAIGLGRSVGVNQTLVSRAPGNVPFYVFPAPFPPRYDSATYPGVEALNSDQFRQDVSAGPKLSLTYRDESALGFELTYFDVLGLSAATAVGPDNPPNWLVMKAPGSFWQTQDFPYQAVRWSDATTLYGVEADGRLTVSSRVTLLAGFRWLQLNDELQGTLTPVDLGQPTWKEEYPSPTLWQIPLPPAGAPVAINPPFWTTRTTNNLYGFQIGGDAKLWEFGRLALDAQFKAGVYDDVAGQSALVSMAKQLYPARATASAAALAGEADLSATYRLAHGFALKAGYEALWLDGVALAPGQIPETYTTSPSPSSPATPTRAVALGVNHRGNALFQGVDFGLAYSF
jgi:hypothetical protein